MNITTNMPSGMTFEDYKRLYNDKVQINEVESLPISNIKTYPVLYKTIHRDKVTLHEYDGTRWLSYGGDLGIVELTQSQYDSLSDEDKERDIIYKLTDVSVNNVVTKEHVQQSIYKEEGIHNVRYYQGKLQIFDGVKWFDAQAKITVDSTLSETSVNPVQNRIIANKIKDIEDTLNTDVKNVLNDKADNKTFVGSGSNASSGLVPAPPTTQGTGKYLREDGTWQVPPDTTYNDATTSTHGLMSTGDKSKLDGIENGATNSKIDVLSSDPSNPPNGYMWVKI